MVRSTNLDTWTREQVQYIIQLDNVKSNTYWEKNLPVGFNRPQVDIQLRTFLREKYEFKKYVDKSLPPPTIDNQANHPWFTAPQQNDDKQGQQQSSEEASQIKSNENTQNEVPEQQKEQVEQKFGDLLSIDSPVKNEQPKQQVSDPWSELTSNPAYNANNPQKEQQWDAFQNKAQYLQTNDTADKLAQAQSTTPPQDHLSKASSQNQSPTKLAQDPFASVKQGESQSAHVPQFNPQQVLQGTFGNNAFGIAPTPTNTPVVTAEQLQSQDMSHLRANSNSSNPQNDPFNGTLLQSQETAKKQTKEQELFQASMQNLTSGQKQQGVPNRPSNQGIQVNQPTKSTDEILNLYQRNQNMFQGFGQGQNSNQFQYPTMNSQQYQQQIQNQANKVGFGQQQPQNLPQRQPYNFQHFGNAHTRAQNQSIPQQPNMPNTSNYPSIHGQGGQGSNTYNQNIMNQVPTGLNQNQNQQNLQQPPQKFSFSSNSNFQAQQNKNSKVFSGMQSDSLDALDPLRDNQNKSMNAQSNKSQSSMKSQGSQQSNQAANTSMTFNL